MKNRIAISTANIAAVPENNSPGSNPDKAVRMAHKTNMTVIIFLAPSF
ncbi:MAG: hypothetical protein HRT71_03160 [Flavobacteriales bacterium]|nr:hypothetical protein [Flavobacteriales bacterium]